MLTRTGIVSDRVVVDRKVFESTYELVDPTDRCVYPDMEKPNAPIFAKKPGVELRAVAYDSPKELQSLDGKINGDSFLVGSQQEPYASFDKLVQQVKDGNLFPSKDPVSKEVVRLILNGEEDAVKALPRDATSKTQRMHDLNNAGVIEDFKTPKSARDLYGYKNDYGIELNGDSACSSKNYSYRTCEKLFEEVYPGVLKEGEDFGIHAVRFRGETTIMDKMDDFLKRVQGHWVDLTTPRWRQFVAEVIKVYEQQSQNMFQRAYNWMFSK